MPPSNALRSSNRPSLAVIGWRRLDRAALLRGTALRASALAILASPALLPDPAAAQLAASARPTGGSVSAGQASISSSASTTTINQSSQRAAINWQSFNVGSAQTVQFDQPNAQAMTLNRVVGADPSQIAGHINANGQITIINQSGVVFARGAQVDTAGLVVSAAGMTDANFMAGRMVFDQAAHAGATISNAGNITIRQAGLAALVAPRVANSGTITAQLGRVILGGAVAHTLDMYGDGLVALNVTGQVTKASLGGQSVTALVTNNGTILAPGGTVVLTAAAADGVVTTLVEAGGSIAAPSVGAATGRVLVSGVGGGVTVDGNVSASGTDPGTVGGQVAASASGTVTVAQGATVDASGDAGGGSVSIGSSASAQAAGASVAAGATLSADAGRSGNGGRITVASAGSTQMQGATRARGGSQAGSGGLISIAGAHLLATGTADASAAHGSVGALDLTNGTGPVYVADGFASGSTIACPATDSCLTYAMLAGAGHSGTLTTSSGDIDLLYTNSAVFAGATNTLTLGADRLKLTTTGSGDINIDQGVSISADGVKLTAAGAIDLGTKLGPDFGLGVAITRATSVVSTGSVLLMAQGGTVDAGNVTIGNATLTAPSLHITITAAGAISVAGLVGTEAMTGPLTGTVSLSAGSTIDEGNRSSGAIVTATLAAQAAGGIALGGANTVDALGAVGTLAGLNDTTGAVLFSDLGPLSIGADVTGTNVSLTAAGLTQTGGMIEAATGNLSIDSSAGIGFGGTLGAPGGIATLIAAGTITETAGGVLDAGTLAGSAATGASFDVNSGNSLGTLGNFTATGGTFALTDDSGLTIHGVVKAGGSIDISSGQGIIQAAGTIDAGTDLTLTAGDGIIQDADGGGARLPLLQADAGTLTLTAAGAHPTIYNTTTTTGISFAGLLSAAAGDAQLTASEGSIAEAAGAGVTATRLSGFSASTAGFGGNNAIITLGSFSSDGGFTLNDAGTLTVDGPLTETGGIALTTTGGLVLSGVVTAESLSLTAGAAITEPGGVLQVGTLAAFASAGLTLDGGSNTIVSIGSLGALSGLNAGQDLTLHDTGMLTIDQGITAGGTIDLQDTADGGGHGGITQTAGAIKATGALTLSVAVGNLSFGGTLQTGHANGFVGSTTLTADSGNILETATGALDTAALTGAASGAITLNLASGNTIADLASLTTTTGDIDVADSIVPTVDHVSAGGSFNLAGPSGGGSNAILVLSQGITAGGSVDLVNGGGILQLGAASIFAQQGVTLNSINGGIAQEAGASIIGGTVTLLAGGTTDFSSYLLNTQGVAIGFAGIVQTGAASNDYAGAIGLTATAGSIAESLGSSSAGQLLTADLSGSATNAGNLDNAANVDLSTPTNQIGTITGFAAGGTFTLVDADPLTVAGAVTAGRTFTAGTTDISIAAPTLTLDAGDAISLSNRGLVSLQADQFVLNGSISAPGGTVALDTLDPVAFDVGTQAGDTLPIADLGNIAVGAAGTVALGSLNAITAGHATSLVLAGGTAMPGNGASFGLFSLGSIDASGAVLSAATLYGAAGSMMGNGSATLTDTANAIGTLADFTTYGSFALNDGISLQVPGTVAAIDHAGVPYDVAIDVLTTGSPTAPNTLTIGATGTIEGRDVALATAGVASGTAIDAITEAKFGLVDAVGSGGTLSLSADSGSIAIGGLLQAGTSSADGTVTLAASAGDILETSLNAGAPPTGVIQTGTLMVEAAGISAAGADVLLNGANLVGTLAGAANFDLATGTLALTDQAPLTLTGSLTGTKALQIATTGASTDALTLGTATAGATLTGGVIYLKSAGALNQLAGGSIIANGTAPALSLLAEGTLTIAGMLQSGGLSGGRYTGQVALQSDTAAVDETTNGVFLAGTLAAQASTDLLLTGGNTIAVIGAAPLAVTFATPGTLFGLHATTGTIALDDTASLSVDQPITAKAGPVYAAIGVSGQAPADLALNADVHGSDVALTVTGGVSQQAGSIVEAESALSIIAETGGIDVDGTLQGGVLLSGAYAGAVALSAADAIDARAGAINAGTLAAVAVQGITLTGTNTITAIGTTTLTQVLPGPLTAPTNPTGTILAGLTAGTDGIALTDTTGLFVRAEVASVDSNGTSAGPIDLTIGTSGIMSTLTIAANVLGTDVSMTSAGALTQTAGTIDATTGTLSLTARGGDLGFGGVLLAGMPDGNGFYTGATALTASAGAITDSVTLSPGTTLTGALQAGTLAATASGAILLDSHLNGIATIATIGTLTGLTASGGDITVNDTVALNVLGSIAAPLGIVTIGDDFGALVPALTIAANVLGTDVSMTAGGALTQTAGTIDATAGTLSLTARGGDLGFGSLLLAGMPGGHGGTTGATALTASAGSITDSVTLSPGTTLTGAIQTGTLAATASGAIRLDNRLNGIATIGTVGALTGLTATGGDITVSDTVSLNVIGSLAAPLGTITIGDDFGSLVPSLTIGANVLGLDVSMTAAGGMTQTAGMIDATDGSLSLTALDGNLSFAGLLQAGPEIGSTYYAGQTTLTADGGSLTESSSGLLHTGLLSAYATCDIDLDIFHGNWIGSLDPLTSAKGNITIEADGAVTVGDVSAPGTFDLHGPTGSGTGGPTQSPGPLVLIGIEATGGAITLSNSAGILQRSTSRLSSGTGVTLASSGGGIGQEDGAIVSAPTIALSAGGATDFSTYGDGTVDGIAFGGTLIGGVIDAAGTYSGAVSLATTAGNVTESIGGGSQTGLLLTGTLTGAAPAGAITLNNAANTIAQIGTVGALSALTAGLGALVVQDAQSLTAIGTISGADVTLITAGSLTQTAGIIGAAGSALLPSSGTLALTANGGDIAFSGLLQAGTLGADGVTYTGATVLNAPAGSVTEASTGLLQTGSLTAAAANAVLLGNPANQVASVVATGTLAGLEADGADGITLFDAAGLTVADGAAVLAPQGTISLLAGSGGQGGSMLLGTADGATLRALGDILLSTSGSLAQTGGIVDSLTGNIALAIDGSLLQTGATIAADQGSINAGYSSTGVVTSAIGDVPLKIGGDLDQSVATLTAMGEVGLNVGLNIVQSSSTIQSVAGDIEIGTGGGVSQTASSLSAGANLGIFSGTDIFAGTGDVVQMDHSTIAAGTLSPDGSVSIFASGFDAGGVGQGTEDGDSVTGANVSIGVDSPIDQQDGSISLSNGSTVAARGSVDIGGPNSFFMAHSTITAGTTVSLSGFILGTDLQSGTIIAQNPIDGTGEITIQSDGSLSIGATLQAGRQSGGGYGGDIALLAPAIGPSETITQVGTTLIYTTLTGTILTGTLAASATPAPPGVPIGSAPGAIDLAGAGNVIGQIGTVVINQFGTPDALAGVTGGAGGITLVDSAPLTVAAAITDVLGAVQITDGTAASPLPVGLTLAANTTGTGVALTATGGIVQSVGSLAATAGTLSLLALDGGISFAGLLQADPPADGSVTGLIGLSATGNVSELAGGTLVAGNLAASAGGSLSLTGTGNLIGAITPFAITATDTLAGLSAATGDVVLADAQALTVLDGAAIAAPAAAVTLNVTAGDLAIGAASGATVLAAGAIDLTASGAITQTGGSIQSSAGSVSLIASGGDISQTGSPDGVIRTGSIAASATGAIDLGGSNAIGAATSLKAGGSLILQDAISLDLTGQATAATSIAIGVTAGNSIDLSGTITAPTITIGSAAVKNVSVTLAGGTIQTASDLGGEKDVPDQYVALPYDHPGLAVFANTIAQTGLTMVEPITGSSEATILLSLTGNPGAVSFQQGSGTGVGLFAPQSVLLLNLGANGTTSGNIDVAGLNIYYTGTRGPTVPAMLTGLVDGVGGTSAAGFGFVHQIPLVQYQLNGCPVESVSCVLLSPLVVPVTDPVSDVYVGTVRRRRGDDDPSLPDVGAADY